MYNNIGSYPEEAMEDGLPAGAFRRDMSYLVENKYTVVDLDEAMQLANGRRKIPDKVLTLTFDGGYQDAYTTVFPTLKELGLPATFCVGVNDVGGSIDLGGVDVPCLEWDQVREIADDGFEIAAYTLSGRIYHPDNPEMEERLISEIREAAEVIPEKTGRPLRYVSVREGIPGRNVHKVLKDTGIEAFLAKCPTRRRPHRYSIGRIQVDDDDPNIFFVKISRNYLRFKDSRTWPYLRRLRVTHLAHRISDIINARRAVKQ